MIENENIQHRLSEKTIHKLINLATFVFFALGIILITAMDVPNWRRIIAYVIIVIAYGVALAMNTDD